MKGDSDSEKQSSLGPEVNRRDGDIEQSGETRDSRRGDSNEESSEGERDQEQLSEARKEFISNHLENNTPIKLIKPIRPYINKAFFR